MNLQHEWQERLATVSGTDEPIEDDDLESYGGEGYDEHPGEMAYYWRGVERAVVYQEGDKWSWWVTFEQYGPVKQTVQYRDGVEAARFRKPSAPERKLYAEGEAKSEEAALQAADETLSTFERIWNRG